MRALRNHGLSIFFGVIFVLALIGQALTGLALFNEERAALGLAAVSLARYLTSSAFAVDVSENRQSEFLAVGSMVVLSIYLRQRGSPESKPVGAPHAESAVEG